MDSNEARGEHNWLGIDEELEEGKRLYQSGDRAGAEAIFKRLIHRSPDHEDAWLWLAYIAPTDAQRLRWLREASLYLPDSERLQQARDWALEQYRASGALAEDIEPELLAGVSPPERPAGKDGARAARGARRRRGKGASHDAAAEAAAESAARTAPRLDAMARNAGQSVRQSFDDARQWGANVTATTKTKFHGLGLYAVSIIGVAAIALLVFVTVSSASQPAIVISPLVLPTEVIDATPTPTSASRIEQERVKVEVAWTKADWDGAIRALDTILALDPTDQEARTQLAEALHERAQDAIAANDLESAKADLDRAIKANASNADLQRTRSDLERYRQGLALYQTQQWQAAVDKLTPVYEKNPEFRDTPALLADSHEKLGDAALEAQDWYEAEKQYAACLSYAPDKQSCLESAEETANIITPPTRIEVSLSKYWCDVYENGEVIRSFSVCTGRPSSPTVPGRYQILDKMETGAYASKWNLDMPLWMGIYWAGGSENGFHAYPIREGTQVLWRGALGTGCSFGCIVLDNADAEWLFNWAQIGTVVFVRE